MRTLGSIGIGLKRGSSQKGGLKPLYSIDLEHASSLPASYTHTRGTLATMFDDAGTLVWCPHNICLQSASAATSPWSQFIAGTGVAPVVTGSYAADPWGGTTGTRVQLDHGASATAADRCVWRTGTLGRTLGETWTSSIYIRATDSDNVGKTVRVTDEGYTVSTIVTLTLDYQRVTLTATVTGASNSLLVECRGTYTTQTADVIITGAQVNRGATAQPHSLTTTAAYYGPRFGRMIPGGPRGYIEELQRTNLFLYSQDQTQGAWSKTRSSVTGAGATAPDGTVTMCKLIEDASATNDHFTQQTVAKAASATTYTWHGYFKAGERSAVTMTSYGSAFANRVEMTVSLSSGTVLSAAAVSGAYATASGGIVAIGGGIYWVWMTYTTDTHTDQSCRFSLHNGSSTVYTGDGASGIYVWGAQLEAANYASTCIPTTTASATRSADLAVATLSTLVGASAATALQTQGGIVVRYAYGFAGSGTDVANRAAVGLHDGTSDNRHLIYNNGGTACRTATATVIQGTVTDATAIAADVWTKAAFRWVSGNDGMSVDGRAVVADTTTPDGMPAITQVTLGSTVSGTRLGGVVGRIDLYALPPTDAELKALSAP